MLLFVPPGVGLLIYGDLLKHEWLPISAALSVSTVLVLGIVGIVQQRLEEKYD